MQLTAAAVTPPAEHAARRPAGAADAAAAEADVNLSGTINEQTEDTMDSRYASTGFVTFLFGIFCAYWAQTTNRNPWAWFFFGLFLAPIAGVVLLYKNSKDRQAPKAS